MKGEEACSCPERVLSPPWHRGPLPGGFDIAHVLLVGNFPVGLSALVVLSASRELKWDFEGKSYR